MTKLLGIIAKLAKAIRAASLAQAADGAAANRLHKKASKAYDRSVALAKKADQARAAHKPRRAHRLDGRAVKKKARSVDLAAKSQRKVAAAKLDAQRVHDLTTRSEDLKAEVKKLKASSKVKIKGNKATGGSARDRLKAVALAAAAECASGKRANFYSQTGAWDVDHAITGEPHGHRSDCSSFVTACFKAAGLPDPNGNRYGGGYTGTLGSHGRAIPESKIQPGDLVLYGPYPHHHVEMYVGPGSKTIGHGSAPVDPGVVHLLSGPITIRSYV